jgi:hypothetical protein
MGNLRLNANEEKAVVTFLKTLTDDYPIWGKDASIPVGTPSPFNVKASLSSPSAMRPR